MPLKIAILFLAVCVNATAAPVDLVYWRGASGQGQQSMEAVSKDGDAGPVLSLQGGGPIAWSPDGTHCAYSSTDGPGRVIRIYDVAAGTESRIPHRTLLNSSPQWSADGAHLAYLSKTSRNDEATVLSIFSIEAQVEVVWGGSQGLLSPSWMPNNKLILALDPDEGLNPEGVDMAAIKSEWASEGALLAVQQFAGDGQYTTELVLTTRTQTMPILPVVLSDSDRYAELNPVMNRQGDRVAYESNAGGDREIYMLGKRGVVNMTNHPAADWNPQWSRDGKTLVFESFRSGRRGIYRVFSDTALVQPVAASEDFDCWDATISPDGESIAYVRESGLGTAIYRCTMDGTRHRQIAASDTGADGIPRYVSAPAWRP